MDKPVFSIVPLRPLFLGHDAERMRLDWTSNPMTGPMRARKIMLLSQQERDAIFADLGGIMTGQKSRDSNITWRQEEKDQE